MSTIIKNATIVNENKTFKGGLVIENEIIKYIFDEKDCPEIKQNDICIDAENKLLMPGVIDDQVHFREPGLTHKADIYSESRAAAAGGVTSFMDMPNTVPPALTHTLLEEKYAIAAERSLINYSFYLGASNSNIDEIRKVNPKTVCGVKVFMGSSTGNMLVDDEQALSAIFAESPVIVATHCEDETIIRENIAKYKQYTGKISAKIHPLIRTEEACCKSSARAIELAQRYNTRLHVLHISTAKETTFFDKSSIDCIPQITSELCVHYLWFCEQDYEIWNNKIKCNPAIKTNNDREVLRQALKEGRITVAATDHAPHSLQDKQKPYFEAPSGIPTIQYSLPLMFELYKQSVFTLFDIVNRMCHCPAKLFNIHKRGYIREGYYADLTLVDLNCKQTITDDKILSKCGWSPFTGKTFATKIDKTWVNGILVYDKDKIIDVANSGRRLEFER